MHHGIAAQGRSREWKASTIHRALEFLRNGTTGGWGSQQRKGVIRSCSKFVIVDESSMLDTLGADFLSACHGTHGLSSATFAQLPPVDMGLRCEI